ncbi:hypothetical protein M0804_008992 [Polistes exclamans]|nr:hypothetical protein M0804_008992 [Polistes exclamans]
MNKGRSGTIWELRERIAIQNWTSIRVNALIIVLLVCTYSIVQEEEEEEEEEEKKEAEEAEEEEEEEDSSTRTRSLEKPTKGKKGLAIVK